MKLRNWIILLALGVAACSTQADRPMAAIPTGPSAIEAGGVAGGGVSGPSVVPFPGRADTLDFRKQLESKYSAMGRPLSQTYVDQEGEATWIGEYDRYRVNGCDHDTATRNVLSLIDGSAPAPVCSVLAFPETAVFPPRDHVVDFRRQLGVKYQSLGRSAQSAVDPDGAAIWTSEYLRYRTSGCDHATATQKTLAQVDGGAAAETCLVQCSYVVDSPRSAPAAGGDFFVEPDRRSGSCEWLAQSEVSWLVLRPPVTGGHRSRLSYAVLPNSGGSRSGRIRVYYPGAIAYVDVNQASPSQNLSFQFFDPAVSASPTTECQIKATATICTVAATSLFPTAIANYNWRVEYAYNGSQVKTQSGALSTLSFTESCSASTAGATIPITVTLTASDTLGNSATVTSGQGSQPALQLRGFACP